MDEGTTTYEKAKESIIRAEIGAICVDYIS